jgi:hypothetical protein
LHFNNWIDFFSKQRKFAAIQASKNNSELNGYREGKDIIQIKCRKCKRFFPLRLAAFSIREGLPLCSTEGFERSLLQLASSVGLKHPWFLPWLVHRQSGRLYLPS